MADGMQKDWRELCVAVTNESEDTKPSLRVQQLIEALDQGERRWRHTLHPPGASVTNQEPLEHNPKADAPRITQRRLRQPSHIPSPIPIATAPASLFRSVIGTKRVC
jgi:hypothetical protein